MYRIAICADLTMKDSHFQTISFWPTSWTWTLSLNHGQVRETHQSSRSNIIKRQLALMLWSQFPQEHTLQHVVSIYRIWPGQNGSVVNADNCTVSSDLLWSSVRCNHFSVQCHVSKNGSVVNADHCAVRCDPELLIVINWQQHHHKCIIWWKLKSSV